MAKIKGLMAVALARPKSKKFKKKMKETQDYIKTLSFWNFVVKRK